MALRADSKLVFTREQIHGAQPSKKLDMLNKWPFFLWATWVRAGRLCNLLSALGCLRHHWGWLWVNIRGLLGACEPSEDMEKHSRPTGYPRSRPTPPSQKSRNSKKSCFENSISARARSGSSVDCQPAANASPSYQTIQRARKVPATL